MFYLVNASLHTAHTVKPGSSTEKKIKESNNAKTILIGGHNHRVFSSVGAARTHLSMLTLHGVQN